MPGTQLQLLNGADIFFFFLTSFLFTIKNLKIYSIFFYPHSKPTDHASPLSLVPSWPSCFPLSLRSLSNQRKTLPRMTLYHVCVLLRLLYYCAIIFQRKTFNHLSLNFIEETCEPFWKESQRSSSPPKLRREAIREMRKGSMGSGLGSCVSYTELWIPFKAETWAFTSVFQFPVLWLLQKKHLVDIRAGWNWWLQSAC